MAGFLDHRRDAEIHCRGYGRPGALPQDGDKEPLTVQKTRPVLLRNTPHGAQLCPTWLYCHTLPGDEGGRVDIRRHPPSTASRVHPKKQLPALGCRLFEICFEANCFRSTFGFN